MKKIINHRGHIIIRDLIFLIFLLIIIDLTSATSFADAGKIFRKNNKAVVVIITYDKDNKPIGQGSGFAVRKDGIIVTNYHVISNAINIKVKAGKKIYNVDGLLHSDKENDLVVLKVKAKNLSTVKLGDAYKASIGGEVFVISSPKGLDNTISEGILSGIHKMDSDRQILHITAPVSGGSSGSPVFNNKGEVIGVATVILENAQNLNFAISINLIKNKFINKKTITPLADAKIVDYKKTEEYWFCLGVAYKKLGMDKEAGEAYKKSIQINPNYADAHFNLGRECINLGMHKEAIAEFKETIRINPNYSDAHFNLGREYAVLGMDKEAGEAYKKSIQINPNYSEAHFNLGVAYGKITMHRESISEFKKAIRINPNYSEAHNGLGLAYGRLGMFKEAIAEFKEAIRTNPNYSEAHAALGLVSLELKDIVSALDEYKILKNLDAALADRLFNEIYK